MGPTASIFIRAPEVSNSASSTPLLDNLSSGPSIPGWGLNILTYKHPYSSQAVGSAKSRKSSNVMLEDTRLFGIAMVHVDRAAIVVANFGADGKRESPVRLERPPRDFFLCKSQYFVRERS